MSAENQTASPRRTCNTTARHRSTSPVANRLEATVFVVVRTAPIELGMPVSSGSATVGDACLSHVHGQTADEYDLTSSSAQSPIAALERDGWPDKKPLLGAVRARREHG